MVFHKIKRRSETQRPLGVLLFGAPWWPYISYAVCPAVIKIATSLGWIGLHSCPSFNCGSEPKDSIHANFCPSPWFNIVITGNTQPPGAT